MVHSRTKSDDSTLTGDYSFDSEFLDSCPAASRMERIANQGSSMSSLPMMPTRMDSVRRIDARSVSLGPSESATAASAFPGSSGLPSTTARGGSALHVSVDPTRKIRLHDASIYRVQLKRVSPSRREYGMDKKSPPALCNNNNNNNTISPSCSAFPQQQHLILPVRRQSDRNLNDGHGHDLSSPLKPQRKSTLIVKRDSIKGDAPADSDHEETEHDGLDMFPLLVPRRKSTVFGRRDSCQDPEGRNDGFHLSSPKAPQRRKSPLIDFDDHHHHEDEEEEKISSRPQLSRRPLLSS